MGGILEGILIQFDMIALQIFHILDVSEGLLGLDSTTNGRDVRILSGFGLMGSSFEFFLVAVARKRKGTQSQEEWSADIHKESLGLWKRAAIKELSE